MTILNRISIYYFAAAFLTSLYVLGAFTFGVKQVLIQALPVVSATVFVGFLLDYFELKRWTKPITPLITGLILGLVAQFGAAPLSLAIISIFSMIVKFLVKWDGKHIFNPAASGLLLGMIILQSYPSWWVGGYHPWIFLIWIPVLLLKLKRWAPMVGFLLPLTIASGLALLTSPSLLFFTSVMLIEPKTSPSGIKSGLVYGVVVALGYLLLSNVPSIDPLITALLIGNLTKRFLTRYNNI